jgi:hypothetical protein
LTATDLQLVKEAIYWRGLFISRYAAVEFAIAELVSRASLHQAYVHLGHPPFGPAKKLKRLNHMIELAGPIAGYEINLKPKLDEFAQHEDHRHFMVHALMVPKSRTNIKLMMYDHREGVYSVGELQFELEHLETLANEFAPLSIAFTELTAKMCREIPLPEA